MASATAFRTAERSVVRALGPGVLGGVRRVERELDVLGARMGDLRRSAGPLPG